jgi:hypothetical protein
MADFTRDSEADMTAGNPGIDLGMSGSMKDMDWGSHREWLTRRVRGGHR